MMAFDSQGIALILIVAVLSLVVGGAALVDRITLTIPAPRSQA